MQLSEIAKTDPYREPVAWLRCFRGIDTLTAILILAELHDFRRFQSPRALMAYLGLVPGEDSSGERLERTLAAQCSKALPQGGPLRAVPTPLLAASKTRTRRAFWSTPLTLVDRPAGLYTLHGTMAHTY
jgi:transposase